MDLPFSMSGRKLPVILQAEQSECGLASLAMVLCYHGYRVDLSTLRGNFAISRQGATLKTLMHIADRLHLASRPLRLELEDLGNLKAPAILHWDMNHFVVLRKAGSRQVWVHDPAVGEKKYDYAELGRHFTGIALELNPTAEFQPGQAGEKLRFSHFWHKSRGVLSSLLQLLLLSLLLQIFSLALPFYTQIFIDEVLVSRDFALLEIMAVAFFLITLIRSLTELLRSYVVLHISNSLSFQFAVNVFRHLLCLPLDYFSKRHMGDVVSRFGSLNNIKDFLTSGIVEVIIDGVMVIGTLTLMFIYSRLLTFVALIAVVIYGALRFFLYGPFRARNDELIRNSALENTNFMENIRAIQGIKLFAKESDRLAGWQNFYVDVINAGVRLQKLGITVKFVHGLLVGTENIVLMLLGGYAVLNNEISIGMIIAYISFKDQFYNRVFTLMDKLFELKLLELHFSRLADIVLTRPEKNIRGIGAPPPEVCLVGCLEARDLSFRYAEEAPWLFRNVNLSVDTEESVAVVGPTGCGKSTLLRILVSLLEPDTGTVSMHGMPITSMGFAAYRDRIAAVMQDDTLLSGSIFDNITFFDPQPDRERVEYVAHLAAIANDIRVMPMQYDTLVGSMGAALSGGQIQRILLARALYKRPRLLVLDEASSHLDLDTEKAVNTAIRQMKIARLMVAHRPQTILLADRILRLGSEGLLPAAHGDFMNGGQSSPKSDVIML
ncbi:MAG: peptidase domain-containing ABC transporter [Pseudomonadales bacterium]|nr:peptidase domain-containing ABC transporter [Pseudomonadales bacterium]